MKVSSRPMASRPVRTAKPSVPSRVESSLRAAFTVLSSSSAAQDGDAGAERVHVARLRAGSRADVRYVLDEVADDVAGVVVGDWVVTLALARVVEALALAGPAGDVEGGEVAHRHRRAAAAAERAERRQQHLDEAWVGARDVRELAPVVRRRAAGGLV